MAGGGDGRAEAVLAMAFGKARFAVRGSEDRLSTCRRISAFGAPQSSPYSREAGKAVAPFQACRLACSPLASQRVIEPRTNWVTQRREPGCEGEGGEGGCIGVVDLPAAMIALPPDAPRHQVAVVHLAVDPRRPRPCCSRQQAKREALFRAAPRLLAGGRGGRGWGDEIGAEGCCVYGNKYRVGALGQWACPLLLLSAASRLFSFVGEPAPRHRSGSTAGHQRFLSFFSGFSFSPSLAFLIRVVTFGFMTLMQTIKGHF